MINRFSSFRGALGAWLSILTALLLVFLFVVQVRKVRKTFNIAVLGRNAPFAEQVFDGIREGFALHPEADFDVRFFCANALDKVQMQGIVEEVLSADFDAVMTAGMAFTFACLNTMKKRNLHIPLVYGGSGDPITQGVVSDLLHRPEAVTGVSIHRIDYREPVDLIIKCKPTLRSILIPHFPVAFGGEIEKSAQLVGALFKERGVKAYLLPLQHLGEVGPRVAGLLDMVDTVMCLEGDRIDEANALLVKLCNKRGITLFAKEIESVKEGAAIGFATYAKSLGEMMVEQLCDFLLKGVSLGDMPIHFVNGGRVLVINKRAAKRQGLELTPTVLSMASQVYEGVRV